MTIKTDRRSLIALAGAALAGTAAQGGLARAAQAADEDACDALFVIRAQGMRYEAGTLALSAFLSGIFFLQAI